MPDVPERCPECHSPVAERFPHAVMYDCGFSLFNDGQPVTDDYPAECQRRRIKRLEKQLAAARAEAEPLRDENERLYRRIERLEAKVARQRVMLTRLQAAIERRATGDWVEATRRAMADEVVERHVREADVALDEAERWRQKYEALQAELAAARAEAERWRSCAFELERVMKRELRLAKEARDEERKRYEALRAGLQQLADDLYRAADEAHDNWRITADLNEQGRSIGLEEAEQMVRRLLDEAGGGGL